MEFLLFVSWLFDIIVVEVVDSLFTFRFVEEADMVSKESGVTRFEFELDRIDCSDCCVEILDCSRFRRRSLAFSIKLLRIYFEKFNFYLFNYIKYLFNNVFIRSQSSLSINHMPNISLDKK